MMDRIFTSRPVNRQSAMVTARGVHWEPAKKTIVQPWDVRSDAPLPTVDSDLIPVPPTRMWSRSMGP